MMIKCLRIATVFSLFGVFMAGLVWFESPDIRPITSGVVPVQRLAALNGFKKFELGPNSSEWTPYQSISRHLVHAVLVSEDARFFEHYGVDYTEIWQSLKTNLTTGSYTRGASTITQQVVKLALLSPQKTLARKIREVLGAWKLELNLSKQQIMTWYLNLANFGHGGYGIEKAAQVYFGKSAEQLSVSESVHLALVLPSPNKWSKGLQRKRLSPFLKRRYEIILTRMLQMGYINQSLWEQAMFQGDFGSPIQSNIQMSNLE